MTDDLAEHAPHRLDVAFGSRIRELRHDVGLSQQQLAQRLGITFQQVQKYEHGTNRVSFSRLMEIARALGCDLRTIIGDLDPSKPSPAFARHIAGLNEAGGVDLLEAYTAIRSPRHRRAILNLAKQLAEGAPTELAG